MCVTGAANRKHTKIQTK